MCDGCFIRSDKKDPKLSSVDTTVTMTSAAQESFKQCRKFKDVKKNAKRWSKKGGASSSSDPPPAKKAKSSDVHMIITSDTIDDDSTEHPSKTARLVSPNVEDVDQSEDDDSDVDHELEGVASSSKSGGVTSCSKSDDKAHDSTKTRLKARGSSFAPVLRPEGSRPEGSSPTRGWAFLPTGLYILLPVMRINLQVLAGRWDDLFSSGIGFWNWIWRHRN